MSPTQDEKVIEKIRHILSELPENYTGRLTLGIDFQYGTIGHGGMIRVTKDVRQVPVVGQAQSA